MRNFSSLTLLMAALPVAAAPSSATLAGSIQNEQGQPVPNARVLLINPASGNRMTSQSDAKGRYSIVNIPFHTYRLEISAPNMADFQQNVELKDAAPLRLDATLKPLGAVVEVQGTMEPVERHPSSHMDLGRTALQLGPAPVQSRAMDTVLLSTPGAVADENGRFHVKGSHGQVMYVVDGIPITDQLQATFSNSLDPSQAESMDISTGGISAEFGGKPVAVVSITSKSGLGTPGGFQGEVSAGAARFSTYEAGFSLRGGSDSFGYAVSGAASQSQRFLDPANFENFHNNGTTHRIFTRFDWVLSSQDVLRLSFYGGNTHRDVGNLATQEAAGQNQRASTSDVNLNLGWLHSLDGDRSFDSAIYFRQSEASLDPTRELLPGFQAGGPDTPYWAWQQRRLMTFGAQSAYTQRFGGGSTLKAGLQYVAYPIHERFRFAVTQDGLVDVSSPLYAYTPAGGGQIWNFEDRIAPRMASAFVQSDLHLDPVLLALGLRYDSYTVKDTTQVQFQPRLGASWSVTQTTLLRASYDRLMILRENENLALSLSQQAWDLGPYAGTTVPELRPELQDSVTVGFEQQVGRAWRFIAEYWYKHSTNTGDSGQFLNTGIVFPIGMSRGEFHGWTLRAELAPKNGFSGYLSLGATRARVQAPVVGGLQLADPEAQAGEWFLIDHDQKLSGQIGITWEQGPARLGAVCRYDSGLVAGDPSAAAGNPDYAFGIPYTTQDGEGTWRVKSRTIWNFTAGWTFALAQGRKLELGADLLNAFNAEALYSFLSECGGTHVYPPRTWALHAKYRF